MQLEEYTKDKSIRQLDLLAKISAEPLAQYDIAMLESYRNQSIEDPNVVEIAVIDAENDSIIGNPRTPYATSFPVKLISKEISKDDELLGTIQLVYSLERSNKELKKSLVTLITKSLFSFVFVTLILCFLFSNLVNKRLRKVVDSFVELGSGNFEIQAPDKPNDELGKLGKGVNEMATKLASMVEEIKNKSDELASMNQDLELKVKERTSQISVILDNVTSGFLLVDDKCLIKDGFSKSCNELFPSSIQAGQSLVKLLDLEPRDAEHFTIGITQVFEDILPEECSLGVLPERYQLGEKTIQVTGRCVRNEGQEVESVLFSKV